MPLQGDPPPQANFINYNLKSGNFHTLKCEINKLCSLLDQLSIKPVSVSGSFTLLVLLILDISEVDCDTMETSFLGNIFHVMASCFQPTS